MTAPLVELIMEQKNADSIDVEIEQKKRKSRLKANRRKEVEEKVKSLTLPETLERAAKLVSNKGASNWLTAVPLERHGFVLHKGAFPDALCLRYGWLPEKLPTKCECGSTFSINHALNCPNGAFPTLPHNEVRNFTGKLLAEVCPDVTLELDLQLLERESLDFATANHEDNARADIRARGFWGGNHQCAFFDVKVFNPRSQSYRRSSLESCFRREENAKKRKYEQRITDVEHGSFTPLVFSTSGLLHLRSSLPQVFSTSGGMGNLASTFYKRLASLLSEKRQEAYSSTMGWIRTHLSFSLLPSAIMCIPGARSSSKHVVKGCDSSDLVTAEAHIHD